MNVYCVGMMTRCHHHANNGQSKTEHARHTAGCLRRALREDALGRISGRGSVSKPWNVIQEMASSHERGNAHRGLPRAGERRQWLPA